MTAELQTHSLLATPPDPELLLEDSAAFEQAVAAGKTVAVVGGPYAGRGSVLERATSILDADQTRLRSTNPASTQLDLDNGPLVVDDCQHLYTRRIGGFESLRRALSTLANSDCTVVTGWNSIAWDYLDRVSAVSAVFDEQFAVRELSPDDLETCVRKYRDIPPIEEDTLSDSIISTAQQSVGGVELPIPNVDFGVLNDQIRPTQDTKTVFFSRLCALSSGNLGVALALMDHIEGDTVSPSDLAPPSVELDETGDFLLQLLLTSEQANRGFLADRIGDQFTRLAGRLTRAGFITGDEASLALRPIGVPTALNRTEQRRFL